MRQKVGQLMAFDPSMADREAHFQPTICLRPIQRAAKDDIISLVDTLMNANSATKPRMMPIKHLATNGPVGVLKRCCTMRSGVIRRSDTSALLSSSARWPAAHTSNPQPNWAKLKESKPLRRGTSH